LKNSYRNMNKLCQTVSAASNVIHVRWFYVCCWRDSDQLRASRTHQARFMNTRLAVVRISHSVLPRDPTVARTFERDARANHGLIADKLEGEADQDRRGGCLPRALCRVSDGQSRHSQNLFADILRMIAKIPPPHDPASARSVRLSCVRAKLMGEMHLDHNRFDNFRHAGERCSPQGVNCVGGGGAERQNGPAELIWAIIPPSP